MQEQSSLARDTPGREVSMDDGWHIRILQGMHCFRFVIAWVFPVPGENRGAGC